MEVWAKFRIHSRQHLKTANGRIVYDGGGIDPDIEVKAFDFAPIAYVLISKDHIFNFATEYYYQNPTRETEDPRKLKLSEAEYEAFLSWLSGKDFTYETELEKQLNKLERIAKTEKKYDEVKRHIDELKKAAILNKENDLTTFKEEILMLLEQEITSRYFLQRGLIESTFNKDPDIIEAVNILKDQERYLKILNRE